MKLPIKKEYFDEIKDGTKHYEYRDAHITFICESTGRVLRKKVLGIKLVANSKVAEMYPSEPHMFDDPVQIEFELGD